MSLDLAANRAIISVRKDVNSTNRPGMRVRRVQVGGRLIQIGSRAGLQFDPAGTLAAGSILELARTIGDDTLFPPYDFTQIPEKAGFLSINGLSLGELEVMIIPGQTIDGGVSENPIINSQLFSDTEDRVSAWLIVRGNLTLRDAILQPIKRKLFTVIYVTGNLIMTQVATGSRISMSQRGANTGPPSGIPLVNSAEIRVGPDTLILATGASGASGSTEGEAAEGDDGSTSRTGLQSGGGGGGFNDYDDAGAAVMGDGAAGSPFSGGSGGGGSRLPGMYPVATGSGVELGGQGGLGVNGAGVESTLPSGAGNPNGNVTGNPESNGTGGTLIIIVEGSINTNDGSSKLFTANGAPGVTSGDGNTGEYAPIIPFGGGSGGGIVIVAAGNGFPPDVVEASGGRTPSNAKNAGNGAAVACALSVL